jgi:hypothetical protein
MALDKKKLASLIAVGAGAMALTAEKAEASTINYSGILNLTIRFNPGNDTAHSFNTFTFVGGPNFAFNTAMSNSTSYSRKILARSSRIGGFALTNSSHSKLATFNFGNVWTNDMVAAGGTRLLAGREWGNSSTQAFGTSAFTDKYMLFDFQVGSLVKYGWAEMTLVNVGDDTDDLADGPNLTLISYAYDSTGARIAAGDTGATSPTPEPSTLASSALAALVLGAAGLRRRRRVR